MHVTLHMAISIDGFIARPDGDTSWVSPIDMHLLETRCREAKCMAMGRTTFEEIGNVEGVTSMILTKATSASDNLNLVFAQSPEEIVARAASKGFSKILLAGGGLTNAAFLESDLIDEIFLTVHPIVLGRGIGLFGNASEAASLELLEASSMGQGLIQLHYKPLS